MPESTSLKSPRAPKRASAQLPENFMAGSSASGSSARVALLKSNCRHHKP